MINDYISYVEHPYVTLITYTPDPERVIAAAARLCYADTTAEKIYDEVKDNTEKTIRIILRNGHESPFEHASFTFGIDGISRACSHQLVRHRLASPNQQSQRYVKAHDKLRAIVPQKVKDNPVAMSIWNDTVAQCAKGYAQLTDLGIPAEDARSVLPNATETHMIFTFNARELRHLFSVRCCNRAQSEIREVAWQMLDLVKPIAPLIFSNAGPGCVRGHCPEGTMSCGNPYPRA